MSKSKASPAEIQAKLGGINYPASKQDLLDHARNSGENDPGVINVLENLPDKKYNSPVDISKAVGELE